MNGLKLVIAQCQNGYIVGWGYVAYDQRNQREYVATSVESLVKLIEELALDALENNDTKKDTDGTPDN